MICVCCVNKDRCFGNEITEEEILQKEVLCNYDCYELADDIIIEDVIEESYRRFDEKNFPQIETA